MSWWNLSKQADLLSWSDYTIWWVNSPRRQSQPIGICPIHNEDNKQYLVYYRKSVCCTHTKSYRLPLIKDLNHVWPVITYSSNGVKHFIIPIQTWEVTNRLDFYHSQTLGKNPRVRNRYPPSLVLWIKKKRILQYLAGKSLLGYVRSRYSCKAKFAKQNNPAIKTSGDSSTTFFKSNVNICFEKNCTVFWSQNTIYTFQRGGCNHGTVDKWSQNFMIISAKNVNTAITYKTLRSATTTPKSWSNLCIYGM